MQSKHMRLGAYLLAAGIISKEHLSRALSLQAESGQRLGEILIANGICTDQDIASALSSQLGVARADLHQSPIEPAAVQLLPERFARKHLVIPLSVEGHKLRVAVADPFNFVALQDAEFASSLKLTLEIATPTDILWAIDKHYGLQSSDDEEENPYPEDQEIEYLRGDGHDLGDLRELQRQSSAAPIVRMVNRIITRAIREKASDIHVEPLQDGVAIRLRIDGRLRESEQLPKWMQGAIVSRFKIMADMDIAEKRVPQDGKIAVRVAGAMLDLRISSLPANFGEKIVIRVLDQNATPLEIDKLGLEPRDLELFRSLATRPQGIILVTGPTGSGKTTTLYAALTHVQSVERNITTIEDPIEYQIAGINQVSVNTKAGRTFATVLAALLRQDPDIIMVGEMRNLDTAMVAMQAALTGHLVLSTLHTNSTIATITRLRNLGVPPYLIASTVAGVVAQRLVRRICPHCRTSYEPDVEMLNQLGIREPGEIEFARGAGCEQCGHTGHLGRQAVFEVLAITDRMRQAISADANEAKLRQIAFTEGTRTLTHAAQAKVLAGQTTVEEALEVARVDEGSGAICEACGCVVSPGYLACPQCGQVLQCACPACHAHLDAEWEYCPFCTARIEPVEELDRAAA